MKRLFLIAAGITAALLFVIDFASLRSTSHQNTYVPTTLGQELLRESCHEVKVTEYYSYRVDVNGNKCEEK